MKPDSIFSRILRWVMPAILAIQLFSCNYNFHLGNLNREKGNLEIANVDYTRAFLDERGDEEIATVYFDNREEVIRLLKEKYGRYIDENKYLEAFFLNRRILSLDGANADALAEEEKWLKIVISGQVKLDFVSLESYAAGSNSLKFLIRLNTPNQRRLISTEINPITNTFFAEDYLYDPPEDLLMFYTVNSIGIERFVRLNGIDNSIKFDIEQTRENVGGGGGQQQSRSIRPNQAGIGPSSKEYEALVNFRTPVLDSSTGEIETTSVGLNSILENFPLDKLLESKTDTPWEPGRDIHYSTVFQSNQISVKTDAAGMEFIPQMLYLNTNSNRGFIDFGALRIQQDNDTGIWKIIRTLEEEDMGYRKLLLSNVILRPYLIDLNVSLPFVKS